MLELNGDTLVFQFPDVHPCARMSISFERTLRIPDDGKTYPLPPSLRPFPVRHVEDFQKRLPEKWKKRGGVMLPMYQSEAMWIRFHGHHDPERGMAYPFAVKIAAGKVSALTGKSWSKELKEKDYCVVPLQMWLDGYVVEEGVIRQFVAMPLGGGFSVEEQVTGKAEFGGLQVEVIPMRCAEYERRFPKRPPRPDYGILRGMFNSMDDVYGATYMSTMSCSTEQSTKGLGISSMGLGAGGKMKQQVFGDPYGLSDWETGSKTRCFVHLADSMTWRAITNEAPPTVAMTAEDYTRHGYPWFDYYTDDAALKGTKVLKGVKTVKEVGKAKGVPSLPENASASPQHVHVIPAATHGKQVKDGVWK